MLSNLCSACRMLIASFLSGPTNDWALCISKTCSTVRLHLVCSSWRTLLSTTVAMLQLKCKCRRLATKAIENYLVGDNKWCFKSVKLRASQLSKMSNTCTTWHALTKMSLAHLEFDHGYYTAMMNTRHYVEDDEAPSD